MKFADHSFEIKISLVDDEGNVMQKNTLKEDHGITGSSLTVPFDVKGNFDYEEDGYWEVEGQGTVLCLTP